MNAVTREFQHNTPMVAGEFLKSTSLGETEHINPATGAAQATVHVAGAREIELAAKASETGRRAWADMGAAARRDCLMRLADLVQADVELFTRLAALESGVPVMGGGGMELAQHWFRYYAGWADKVDGHYNEPLNVPGMTYIRFEPIGTVGVIIPWNMPLVAMSMTVVPPLAAGNAVILKPPTLTPFAALRMGELALEAGLPAGVLNVVPGDAEAGEALVAHPSVGKVSFTGGLGVARQVAGVAAQHLKPVTMELGGKSAVLVFEDADLDVAAQVCMGGVVGLSGQGCVNPTRPIVQRSVEEAFIERLVAMLEQIKVGDPLDPGSVMGPVISKASCERILGVIERAQKESMGQVRLGGKRLGGELANGYFIEPTVFGGVRNDCPLAREEVFGPVTAVLTFDDEADAITQANDNAFGLGAYVVTRDLARAHRVAASMQAGSVYINSGAAMSPNMPFGGYKQSGYGRLGGRAGLDEFLQMKNVYTAF